MQFKRMLGLTKNTKTMGNVLVVGNVYTCLPGMAEWALFEVAGLRCVPLFFSK